jgi:rod shape-determining protein MreD
VRTQAVGRVRVAAVLALLVAAHFVVRPRLGDPRFTPDFLLVALLFFAIRARPMAGTIAGFALGIVTGAVAPTAFGAAALALTVVGYLAGWLKAIVFADNLLVTALFVFGAAWLRDAVEVLAAHQLLGGALTWQLLAFSPLAALSTAAAATLTLVVFRGWLRQGAP